MRLFRLSSMVINVTIQYKPTHMVSVGIGVRSSCHVDCEGDRICDVLDLSEGIGGRVNQVDSYNVTVSVKIKV